MVSKLLRVIQGVLLGIIALFKRAMCFLNRRRRDSTSELPNHNGDSKLEMPTEIITSGSFEPVEFGMHQLPNAPQEMSGHQQEEDDVFTDWDAWGTGSKPQPPMHLSSQGSIPEGDEPEPDYFSDLGLAPTIQKQKKVLIKPQKQHYMEPTTTSSRLTFSADAAAPISAELGEWDDAPAGAWDGEDISLEAETAIKQSRKVERERRLAEHQLRKQQKNAQRGLKTEGLASKLS